MQVSCVTLEDGGYSYGAPVPPRHRRTESADASHSCEATSRPHPHVTIRTSFAQVEEVSVKRPSLIQQQSQTPSLGCNSPRQRSRIRTNPWMSSGTTGSSSTGGTDKLQWTTSSSCSDIAPTPLTEDISTAATIGSWRRDDGHTTTTTTADEESAAEEVTAFRRPSRRRRTSQDAERKIDGAVLSPSAVRRGSLTSVSNSTISSSPPSTPRRSSPSSGGGHVEDDEDEDEEDITLNEIGRFDESYVYEKETDILSDSDPTDCEEEEGEDNDYNNGNLTDRHSSSDFLDMSYQNGINNSSTGLKTDFDEDELDFIDNGPLDTSCELPSTTRINTGHCTYYHNNFIDINNRHGGSNNNNNNSNKNIGRPSSINNKRPSRRRTGEGGKRQSSIRKEQEHASPVRRASQRKSDSSRRSVSCGSRRGSHRHREVRVLAEAEVSSEQVTPTMSSTSTPVAVRKKAPENANDVAPDRRSIIPGSRYLSAFPSEVRLIEADKEADRKYQELILEAETLLVHMKSSSVEEEVEPETPTVENPPKPFPSTRPNTASLHLQVGCRDVIEIIRYDYY